MATAIDGASCTGEYDVETFVLVSVPDGDLLGAETFDRQIEIECTSTFDAYVGSDCLTSSLDAIWVAPTKDSRVQNDWSIVCLVCLSGYLRLTSPVKGPGLQGLSTFRMSSGSVWP